MAEPSAQSCSKEGSDAGIADVKGQRALGHDGGGPGVSADLRILPERGYTVVVLAKQDAAAARIGPRALHLLAVLPRRDVAPLGWR